MFSTSWSYIFPFYDLHSKLMSVWRNMFPFQIVVAEVDVWNVSNMNHWHFSISVYLFVWIKPISAFSFQPWRSGSVKNQTAMEMNSLKYFFILLWLHTFVVIAVCLVRAIQLSLTKCWCLWVEIYENNFLKLHQFSCCETSVYAGVRLCVCVWCVLCVCVCVCDWGGGGCVCLWVRLGRRVYHLPAYVMTDHSWALDRHSAMNQTCLIRAGWLPDAIRSSGSNISSIDHLLIWLWSCFVDVSM